MEIDEASSQIMTKVQEILVQLKEDVKSRVAKEKDQMNEQLEVIEKAECVNREHLLHCQTKEELVIMAVDLDKKTKSLIGTPEIQVLKTNDTDVDTAVFDDLSKVIDDSAIVVEMSELIQCIHVSMSRMQPLEKNMTLLPKAKNRDKNTLLMEANIQSPDGNNDCIKQRMETLCVLVGSLQYTPDTRGPHKTSITVNGHDQYNGRFVFHSRDKGKEKLLVLGFFILSHGSNNNLFYTGFTFNIFLNCTNALSHTFIQIYIYLYNVPFYLLITHFKRLHFIQNTHFI